MISDFLLENSALMPVLLALTAVLCVGVGYPLRRRHRVLWVLAALSMVPVLALTFGPGSGRVFVVCVVQFSLPTFGSVELLANVALLFPAVYFATLASRRPVLMLAAGVVLSAAIEVVQIFLPDIGRACDTNDWMMNSAGVIVAVLLARVTIALGSRQTSGQGPAAQGEHAA
ncbi:VanZ family protein [Actinophytocola sp.]|uniref:VanZ family protein n=1 Tax=Actinophytocola sp. TaxID=1872138 RepID=UPI002ED370DF